MIGTGICSWTDKTMDDTEAASTVRVAGQLETDTSVA